MALRRAENRCRLSRINLHRCCFCRLLIIGARTLGFIWGIATASIESALATGAGAMLAEAIDGVASRFDVMNRLPTPSFPGGSALRSPLLALAMTWFAIRDRL